MNTAAMNSEEILARLISFDTTSTMSNLLKTLSIRRYLVRGVTFSPLKHARIQTHGGMPSERPGEDPVSIRLSNGRVIDSPTWEALVEWSDSILGNQLWRIDTPRRRHR